MSTILTSLHGAKLGLDVHGRLLVDPQGSLSTGAGAKAAGIAYTATAASTAISNTTTETAFDNFVTIPANSLGIGSLIKIRYQGIITASTGADTFNHKLYIGGLSGTALLTGTATDAVDNMTFWGEYELMIRTKGSTGTMVGNGFYKKAPAAEATLVLVDDILASTTIDTTIDQAIKVSGTWSAASASDSARLDCLSVVVY